MKVDADCILVTLLFFLVFTSGCKKEDANGPTDNYTLEIDNDYIIYKVSLSSFDWTNNFIIEYVYSPGNIQETLTSSAQPGKQVTIYHINNSGFADSSQFSIYYDNNIFNSYTSYFHYDSNNYMKMKIDKGTDYANQPPDTTFYDYHNGNLIAKWWSGRSFGINFPVSSTYTYNSIKNFVDIESFTGAFMGKLSQNLIESISNYGHPEGTSIKRYQYILNSNGLVEERIRTSFNPGNTDPNPIKQIDKFEYILR